MTSSWKTVKESIIKDNPVRRESIHERKEALALACKLDEIRKARGVTQRQLAGELKTTQENVSRIERAEDLKLSTLSRYIQNLGGTLEIHAVFQDQDINLTRNAT